MSAVFLRHMAQNAQDGLVPEVENCMEKQLDSDPLFHQDKEMPCKQDAHCRTVDCVLLLAIRETRQSRNWADLRIARNVGETTERGSPYKKSAGCDVHVVDLEMLFLRF